MTDAPALPIPTRPTSPERRAKKRPGLVRGLPSELITAVFSFLSSSDLLALELVSKWASQSVQPCWRKQYHWLSPAALPSEALAKTTWKHLFFQQQRELVQLWEVNPGEAMRTLTERKVIENNEKAAAGFIWKHLQSFNKRMLVFKLAHRNHRAILEELIALIDVRKLSIVDSVRILTATLPLPDEGSMIAMFLQLFSAHAFRSNREAWTKYCSTADNAEMLMYAAIILETDAQAKQVRVKMTRANFIKQLTGIPGYDPVDAGPMYDEIYAEPLVFLGIKSWHGRIWTCQKKGVFVFSSNVWNPCDCRIENGDLRYRSQPSAGGQGIQGECLDLTSGVYRLKAESYRLQLKTIQHPDLGAMIPFEVFKGEAPYLTLYVEADYASKCLGAIAWWSQYRKFRHLNLPFPEVEGYVASQPQ